MKVKGYITFLGCHTKVPQTGDLNTFVSQFWRLAVQNKGLGRDWLLSKAVGESLFYASLPASGGLLIITFILCFGRCPTQSLP